MPRSLISTTFRADGAPPRPGRTTSLPQNARIFWSNDQLLHGFNEQGADPELDLLEIGAAADLVLAHLDLPKAHLIEQPFQVRRSLIPS
jgi:hypothetical protein